LEGEPTSLVVDVLYASVPRDKACPELLWRGIRYGSKQARQLSHQLRNETVSFPLRAVNAPGRYCCGLRTQWGQASLIEP
jgi:hypothetical protein